MNREYYASKIPETLSDEETYTRLKKTFMTK